jgi:formylmethanofuran dehydrogenase subunit E
MPRAVFDVREMQCFPEEETEVVVKGCTNCGEPLYAGYDYYKCDSDYFCDRDCVDEYYGIKEITLEEEF